MAEDVGFSRLSVMDHVFQISHLGPPEREMLEAYTALGYLAGQTERISLLTLVTAATYRSPGLLAKMVTTLDVLSGGRAWLGVGAAWNEEEASGLGLFFPPRAERYDRLEELLQICLQMWSDDDGPYRGRHFQLERTLNSPQALSKPHPPILIGGSGEKKTLRLVAKYAQACNVFASDVSHKFEVLRQHCEAEGRDYDEIERTVTFQFDIGEKGERADELVESLAALAGQGAQAVTGLLHHVSSPGVLEAMGEKVIPAVAAL
jgi:F420-dependent oxidoreductase-like protein